MDLIAYFLEENVYRDIEPLAVAFWIQMKSLGVFSNTRKKNGGWCPDEAANISGNYDGSHRHYMKNYFRPVNAFRPGACIKCLEQPERELERSFRLTRVAFDSFFTMLLQRRLI